MTIRVTEAVHGTWELCFTTTAARPAAFEYIRDFERHVDWEERLLEVHKGGAGHRAANTVYLKLYGTQVRPTNFLRRLFWAPTRIDCTITSSTHPDRLTWVQQHWRDQTSDGYERQDVEVRLREADDGCEVSFIRRLMPDDATSLGFAMALYGRMRPAMSQIPSEMKRLLVQASRRAAPAGGDVSAFDLSPHEVAGDLLESLSVGGPGSRSLVRLKTILDRLS